MVGQWGDFGSGSVIKDGIRWGVHYWPISGFKLHFTDEHEFRNIDPNSQEDMKACVYAWGGPKPSWISKVRLGFDSERQQMMIMFLEKRFDPSLSKVPDTGTSGRDEKADPEEVADAPAADQSPGDQLHGMEEV